MNISRTKLSNVEQILFGLFAFRIETGLIHTGDPVQIIGLGAEKMKTPLLLSRGEADNNSGT